LKKNGERRKVHKKGSGQMKENIIKKMCGSVKKREKEKMKKRNFKLQNILTTKK
jgi:hypothetical protein